jgi:hypothetical protein
MKISLLLLLLILCHLGFKCANAQGMVWCPKGAQWHYGYNSFSVTGFVELSYNSDTIVDGEPCKKLIEQVNYVDQISGNEGGYTMYRYTYESDSIIYGYNNAFGSSFWDTLFNFKAGPGDKWHLYLGAPNEYVEVEDTGHQMIQSLNLKWMTVTYYPNSGMIITDTIFERIGCIGFNYPFETSVFGTDGPLVGFCNYSDSLFSDWNNPDIYCTFLPTGISQPNDEEIFNISPNPVFDEITLSTAEQGLCFIADQTGKIIETIKIMDSKTKISTKNLQSGIYIISFKTDKLQYISKLFIQH